MIEIKTLFNDWKPVCKERARIYVRFLLSNLQNIPEEQKEEYIESKHLRGITVKKLFK